MDAKRLFNNFTGLGNYSRTLVRYLQYYYPEHEYHLFTPRVLKNKETEYFFDSGKFTIHTPSSISPLWRSYGMSRQINTLRPDIFHGLSHEIPLGIHPDIVTVVTFHDLIYELYPHQFGWWDRHLYHFKYRHSAQTAQHIIAISNSTQQDIVSMYELDAGKIEVLYQSCNDVFMYDPVADDFVSSVLPKDLRDYYLYVGSIIKRKGLLQSIMAYAKLDDKYRRPFVIVGNGDRTYIRQVKEMISYYKLDKSVYFINGVSNQDLVQIYDKSYCLIYPSVYEGFGIPVIESLFREKPVITSCLSSLPEAAGPGAILTDPYDVDSITMAMKDINDGKIYSRIKSEGYRYVWDKFNPETTTNAVEQFYQKIVSEKKTS